MAWLMTWLVAIGLANALWAALLAAAAVSCGRFLRRPALAHLLWIVALIKLFTPPLVEIPLDEWIGRPSGWLSEAATAFVAPQPDATIASRAASEPQLRADDRQPTERTLTAGRLPAAESAGEIDVQPLSPVAIASEFSQGESAAGDGLWLTAPRLIGLAAAVWLLGSAVLAVWMGHRAWRFYVYLKHAGRADAALQARLDRLARRAGMHAAPRLVVVESVVSPMLWGVGPLGLARGARLVFPAALARRLDDDSCNALLLHELAHYARGDGWVRLLELAAQVLYWWHPLVWLARREIEAVEEECCDAWALEHQTGSRRLYAEALLAAVDFLYEPPLAPLPPAACGLGESSLLRRRLTQIMCGDAARKTSRLAKALVLAAAAVVLPLRPTFFSSPDQAALARSTPPEAELPPSSPFAGAIEQPANHTAAAPSTTAEAVEPRTTRAASLARPPAIVWAAATSPNGKYQLEARTGRKTTLVHVETAWRLDLTAHQITCVSFSPDSRTFATGHGDCAVRIWDSETGGLLMSLKQSDSPIASVSFDPSGSRVAAGGADGGVHAWDWAAASEIARLPRQPAPVACLRFSPRGDRLAIAFGRWNDGDSAALGLWQFSESAAMELHPLAEPAGALDWLDDESLLLAAWDGQAHTWSAPIGRPLLRLALDKNAVSAAAWSPDCRLAAPWQVEQILAKVDRSGKHASGDRP